MATVRNGPKINLYKKNNQDTTPTNKHQRTISQLFSSPEQPLTIESSPTERRRKRSATSLTGSPIKAASVASMYNFSNTQVNGGTVVDLTSSPPNNVISPQRKARRLSLTARVDNSSAGKGLKKLPVKNLRTGPRNDPNDYCNKVSGQLSEALAAIFDNRQPTLSNEELYKASENLCKLGRAPELTKSLLDKCRTHVATNIKEPLVSKGNNSNVDVLRAVIDAWSMWNEQLLVIRAIFFYLDRSYLLQKRLPSIYESAIALFRDIVFAEADLETKIIDGAYELLLADRTGASLDQALFKDAVKMFHDLQVYTSHFEPHMLAKSQHYIRDWADQECAAQELPSYVAGCVKFIDAETGRCDRFDLDTTTRRALLTLLEERLIVAKKAELSNIDSVADILDLSEAKAIEELQQLYALLQRRRLGTTLQPAFEKWIDDTGTGIIFDEKEQEQMIVRLIALKLKLDNIWRFSFLKNEQLGHGLRQSFETFMNKSKKSSATWNTDNSKPSEMIAKYVDMLLKAGAKAIPASLTAAATKVTAAPVQETADDDNEDEDDMDEDAEVNKQLDQVLDLFRFVHGKAVFEAFYKKDLARRLLMGRSASADAEKNMLSRLKTECGAGFTQNLETMFRDIELARDEMTAYKQRLQNNDRKDAVDLNVNILSAAAWPSYPDIPCTIPVEIKKSIDNFENHYYSKHSGRKLSWKHALAHCQLKASFPKGTKELVVSSFQAIVLLLFNGVGVNEHLSYEHIKAESGLTPADLTRTLQSLACAKLRPLTKHPKSRDVTPTDIFTLNSTFTHPKYRVKINSIQLKETKEENKETHERVAADRQFETQAAIVRIMKSRKTITHAELVAEVIGATRTRGVMGVGDIKRNIDKLIEKEYLERGEGNTYNYLA